MGKAQVMKHDAYGLRLFIQWALGWHKAWAYGLGLDNGLEVMGQAVGSKFRAQVGLGTIMPYNSNIVI